MPEIVRHVGRGTLYDVLGEAEVQISFPTDWAGVGDGYRPLREHDRLVIYRGKDDRLWARFPSEFHDGRFENITPVRRWWPDEYVDEVMPTGTISPERWIAGRSNLGWILGPEDVDERIDDGCHIVQPGDIVGFTWHEPRGRRTLTIHGDGTWALDSLEPDDWSWVTDADDFENSNDSLEAFVRDNIFHETLRPGDQAMQIDLVFSRWGNARFRFVVKDNTASFVPEDAAAPAAVIQQAVQQFEAMSSEQQAEHREAQRQSWAKGEAGLDKPAIEGARDDG